MDRALPVITVDGPSGVGKGTLSRALACHYGFNFLDSGAIYRLLALRTLLLNVEADDDAKIIQLARNLEAEFIPNAEDGSLVIALHGEVVTDAIRSEACGQRASWVAAKPEVRALLLERQRAFAKVPGLVADGRDMGTVVFPDAVAKFFLTASSQVRAERRYKELCQAGINVTLRGVLDELEARDHRDRNRSVSPLLPAADAIEIDTSHLSIAQVLAKVTQVLSGNVHIQTQ